MTAPARLRLRAEDAGDLAVISACLEDAVFAVGEMAFEPGRRATAVHLPFQDGAGIWLEAGHLDCHRQDPAEPQPAVAEEREPSP